MPVLQDFDGKPDVMKTLTADDENAPLIVDPANLQNLKRSIENEKKEEDVISKRSKLDTELRSNLLENSI